MDVSCPYLNRLTAPRAVYIDGIWNQEDADKWITIIQAPVERHNEKTCPCGIPCRGVSL